MDLAIPRTSWTARALNALALLFLAFDAGGKLLALPGVVRGTAELGFPVASVTGIGAALALCTLLYAIPRTAPVGAVLVTAYLGGAVAAMVRVGTPLMALFPVLFAVLVWLPLYLRDARVRALVQR